VPYTWMSLAIGSSDRNIVSRPRATSTELLSRAAVRAAPG
jgi:hypothetical protein